MYSKELEILDHNTVMYMIDELQEQCNRMRKEQEQLQEENKKKDLEIAELRAKLKEYQWMNNAIEILDQDFACLVENMGVVNAEHFIALIKRDSFDYTVWQREYFDKMPSGEFAANAAAYAKSHPYAGKGEIL